MEENDQLILPVGHIATRGMDEAAGRQAITTLK
jgi:hypothetical protein